MEDHPINNDELFKFQQLKLEILFTKGWPTFNIAKVASQSLF